MNVGKAVYGILSSTTAVTDIVSTNIFPEIAEQETATPFIVYQLQGVAPEDTHDGPSKLDEVRMEIICFSDSYNGAADLADKVRGALDRVSGTYNGVNVESVQFNNVDIEIEYDPRRYSQVTTYTFRIKRDNITIAAGTPVTGAKLGDLSDVDVAGVSDGQFIKYVAAQQEWQAADSTGGVTSLAALTDVNLTGLGSKDVINYNSTTGKWEPVDFLNVLYTNLKTGVSTTINDGANTNSALELGATTAKLKTGISEILITETSPGDIDFIVATDGSGTTAYTALNIDGSASANEAILNIPVGTQLHIKSPTHYAYLRYSGGANASLSLPTISGTIARTADIALDSAVAANTAKISYTDASAVAANTAKNTYPSADATKLAGIETSADVTDATNVAAAGALMAASAQLTGDLDTQANEIKTTTANGNIIVAPKGTGVLEVKGDTNSAAIILNCEANTHGVTIQSPAHAAGATYTLTLPTSAGTNGQALTTNGSGVLSFSDVAAGTKYHDRFQSNAATFRSGATATVELYYTAKADGDGLAESASSDTPTVGKVIRRKIYYSEAAFADPDTGTWVEFTPAPADDASFATVKAALLEYLKARTGGTVPISLKQTWEEVTAAPAFTGLLNETYGSGAAAAYSVRRLNGNYTGAAIQVERSSDNTTQDIGFDSNGDLDESALSTFCSGTVCKVRTWYGQEASGGTGSGNDAVQTTHANQPTIYTGGAIYKHNGRTEINFDDTYSALLYTGQDINLSAITATVLGRETDQSGSQSFGMAMQSDNNDGFRTHLQGTGARNRTTGTNLDVNVGAQSNFLSRFLHDIASSTALMKSSFNGVKTATGSGKTFSTNGLDLAVGGSSYNTTKFRGNISEAILFGVDKYTSGDIGSIRENVGDYFTQNTPLLDTYTGAAAAYSLRKLRTAYTGNAVEVYNGSSYADIGFNIFGEINTVALADHCGSSDGFVSKWYDQSGNTNTAAQTTTANMPKIYDGTTATVVTRGGKPSVLFTGSTQILPISTSFNNNSYLYVGEPLARSQGFGANNKAVRTDGTAGYRNFGFEWASGNLYVLHNGTVYDATSGGNISVTLGFDVVLFRRGSVGTQTPDSIGKEDTQYISEIISYSTLESDSNLVGISNNANTFYSAF